MTKLEEKDKAKLQPKHRAMVEKVDRKVEAGDYRGALKQTLANAREMLDSAEAAIDAATDDGLRAVADQALDEFEEAVKFLRQNRRHLLP